MSTDSTLSVSGTELTTLNGNDQTSDSSVDLEILILNLLTIIIALVGLAGNAVVLWLLGFQIQKNVFSVYILNLAGADFLYLYFQSIYSLVWVIDISNFIPFDIPNIVYTMLTSTYIAGLSILSALSTAMCLSVLYPIQHSCHQPNNISALICALLWALSLILSILKQNYCGNFHLCLQFGSMITAWLIFLLVFLSVTSLTWLVRLCVSKRTQLTRLYVTMGFTLLVFLLCDLPWGINLSLLNWIHNNNIFSYKFNRLAYVLTCVNSCAKPIIYIFIGSFHQQKQHQRQNLRLVLKKALQDVPDVDGSQGSAPQETLEMLESSHLS
ncbi:mas-related G-protein coupled receptor member X2-like [Sorex araneus]|uniref:mas-related G-protein coupled receptor member X2-like n=1 Tax=Sorex araneus TaxID=42254 RepID=UPI002433CF4E|nr:mas-related G-protein coupled receptor member X2-like [Sorex araneus]